MERQVLLTEEGYSKLIEELNYLVNVRRREVAERIKIAKEFGDISENSEYDDAKNEQAFVEGRIAQINEMLSSASLIDSTNVATDKVSIGCRVLLVDLETGEECDYRLVGSVEADPDNHCISNESPVGKAILGKKVGQKVKVNCPAGEIVFQVKEITK